MALEALIFDFDGTLLDTETPEYAQFVELYREYGLTLRLEDWQSAVGTWDAFDAWAPFRHLGASALERLQARHHSTLLAHLATLDLRPGVKTVLEQAKAKGLKLAIASSSSQEWVMGFLESHGLVESFDALATRWEVEKVKPDPALYRLALEKLGLEPENALALEDSLNGYKAAVGAGLLCAVTPHAVTASLPFPTSAPRLETLEGGLGVLEGIYAEFYSRG